MEKSQPEHASVAPDPASNSRSIVVGEDSEAAACQSCRKRKLKCSRESPACSQCVRLDCTCQYNHKKQKPGLKSGAIEALNRRLEVLERILLDDSGNQKAPPVPSDTPGCVYHASLLLAKEHQPRDGALSRLLASGDNDLDGCVRGNCQEDTNTLFEGADILAAPSQRFPRKRKRDCLDGDLLEQTWDNNNLDMIISALPSTQVIELVVDAFFSIIHPWIPFLHQSRFKEQLDDEQKRPELAITLHALVSATMKYLKEEDMKMSFPEMTRQVRLSRSVVMLTAMDNMTVETIQALIVLAFDDIGSGQVPKAWPVIGSLTRTVEYLQLTVETDDIQHYSLLTPLVLLNKPTDWTESENRRRIFWNVFLLDRFCSVTTGWSTSLTSDDVHRRLPCDGGLWQHDREAVATPYFGIWNKSAAKIGNSIAYIPAHYPSRDHDVDPSSPITGAGFGPVDTSKLGAFAYCIEATESLSQVTTFFLQQKVDFRNRQEAGSWLTRFKELDLRLVHWKMFLPQKWKDSNISRDTAFINMDPNLTLAHITHNTSMILLHQHIAYPPPEWSELIRLPSSCSAATCQSAAIETASISAKYLKYTKFTIVNSQFALCAFVAARVLLVHWRYYNVSLLPEFFSLVESLKVMSLRWRGYSRSLEREEDPLRLDIAGQYAMHLQSLHQKSMDSQHFHTDANFGGLLPPFVLPQRLDSPLLVPLKYRNYIPDFQSPERTIENNEQRQNRSGVASIPQQLHQSNPTSYLQPVHHFARPSQQQQYSPEFFSSSPPCSSTSPINGNRMSPGGIGIMGARSHNSHSNEGNIDEFTAMSNSLLGQQFLSMDRVITLDETDFALDLGMWSNS